MKAARRLSLPETLNIATPVVQRKQIGAASYLRFQ